MPRARLLARLALVSCLIVSTQGLLVIQGAFHLNRAAIAEALCVNKARPEMDCHGRCELERRLNEHHSHERERGEAVLDVSLAVAATITAPPALVLLPSRDEVETTGEGLAFARGERAGVFRPPRGTA